MDIARAPACMGRLRIIAKLDARGVRCAVNRKACRFLWRENYTHYMMAKVSLRSAVRRRCPDRGAPRRRPRGALPE